MEDIRKEQLNILLNGIKKVVGSKNCPEWIARDLTVAVKNAKSVNSENIEKSTDKVEIEETYRQFEVNDKVKMPNVVGMDVNSAINTLEDLGLQVEIQNEGEIIRSQFPAPDTELSKKSIVMIDFN